MININPNAVHNTLRIITLTQAEYNALTPNQQQDPSVVYNIKD